MRSEQWRAIGAALGALACVAGFWGAGAAYGGFRIPYGFGVQEIHPAEILFHQWFLVFALPAVALAARALDATPWPARALSLAAALARRPAATAALGAAAVALAALCVRLFVLQDAPVADDESTYTFIAQTLLEGRVVNPSPGDVGFFRNQFVVLDESTWYGKYPIGHPAVLALGEAVGLRALVVPLLGAATFALAFALGRRALPAREALAGALLLAASPQFVFTAATQLSQPTCGLSLVAGALALLRLDAERRARFAVIAGAAFGFATLARPLPGALFAAAGGLWALARLRGESPVRLVRLAVAFCVPLFACAAILLAVQLAQTGDPTRTSYDAFHGGHFGGFFRLEWMPASLGGAALRQNAWLFGWPLSFAFLPFARRSGPSALLWAMVAAGYAYRLILPKTVVASTGPIYVAEVVPLLALLSASGMAEVARRLARFGVPRARERVAACVLAAFAVAAATFLPLHLRELFRSGASWQTAHRLLDDAGAERAVIFADTFVDVSEARSWAYFPPNPSPRLDDPRIFVRVPSGEHASEQAREFWQRRFPERSAWLFRFEQHRPVLRPLHGPRESAALEPGS